VSHPLRLLKRRSERGRSLYFHRDLGIPTRSTQARTAKTNQTRRTRRRRKMLSLSTNRFYLSFPHPRPLLSFFLFPAAATLQLLLRCRSLPPSAIAAAALSGRLQPPPLAINQSIILLPDSFRHYACLTGTNIFFIKFVILCRK
jgi:hypothetical protein